MFHCPHAGNLTAFGIGYSPGNQAHLSLIACNLRWANCSYFWFRARGLAADLAQWAARPETWLINDHLEGGSSKMDWAQAEWKTTEGVKSWMQATADGCTSSKSPHPTTAVRWDKSAHFSDTEWPAKPLVPLRSVAENQSHSALIKNSFIN